MMLEDYEKLLQVPKAEWEERGMELITARDKCPYHLSQMTRVYKKGTVFESKKRLKYNIHEGIGNRPIWIDIFIFNHIPSLDIAKKLSRKMIMYQRFYYRSKTGMKVIKTDPISVQIRCLRNNMIHKLLSLVKEPEIKAYNEFYKTVKNLDTSGEYVTTFESEIITEMIRSVSKEADMFPLIRVPFEDTEIFIQKNYHEMLTNMYGDYLKLPPIEKRINHSPAILDFGDGKGNLIRGV